MSDFLMDTAAVGRLEDYFGSIGVVLNNKKRRASFAMYAMGILGDGERKSAEPIAARACGDPALANAYHQRLLEFLSESKWSDHDVRRLEPHAENGGARRRRWALDHDMTQDADDHPGAGIGGGRCEQQDGEKRCRHA